MKVVILAGGVGSRLSEETDVRPKPMVEIELIARGYEIMFKNYAPVTYEAFIKNGRVAP